MPTIVPCLWYDSQAEEAAKFYVEVFSGSPQGKTGQIKQIAKYPKSAEKEAGKPAGSVMTVLFELDGQEFMALNGGPIFKFSESVSFIVNCKDQAEIDYFWKKLSAVPASEQCGWLKDKFGLSWQIVPEGFQALAEDPVKFEKAMAAVIPMKKMIVADIEKAANS